MATFTDTIRFVVEAVTGQAQGQLKNLQGDLARAEGAGGKFKAGISSIGGALKDNLGLGLAGAGAAVTAFATKAIGEFQDLALNADKMATATGLAVEDASRWNEVAGDLGVNTEVVANAMNRLNREAAQGKLAEVGVNAEDANGRFLETLELLQGITDEAERAKLGQELLGRSWTELAPLVQEARNLKGALAEVSEAKVIDEEEVAKAKRFRDMMDEVNGVFEDFTLLAGEFLVPALSDVAGAFIDIKNAIEDLPSPPQWLQNLLGKSLFDIGRDFIASLPGGSGEMARTPHQILTGPGGYFSNTPPTTAPRIGATGGGDWGTTNITVNQAPGYRGDEIDRATRDFWQTNGRVTWSGN